MAEPLRFWSVTTLVKIGMGTSDPLVNWAVRTTAEYALENSNALAGLCDKGDKAGAMDLLTRARYRSSGKAAARGSDLHAAAEKMALGVSPEVADEIVPYAEQYRNFLNDHKPEFLLAEAPVYSPSRFYAGTLDSIMVLHGKPVVADIKTCDFAIGTKNESGRERSRPPYPETALQLAAYRRAELVGLLSEQRYAGGKRYYLFDPDADHKPMPPTEGAVCVVVSPADYQVVPVRTDDSVFRAFLAARECARFQVETSKTLFGPPIGSPNPQGALL